MNKKIYTLPKKLGINWVNKLRTTTIKQITGSYYSKSKNGYCSLGIYYLANGLDPRKRDDSPPSKYEEMGEFINPIYWKIVELNDKRFLTFRQIADWVEENVEFI